MSQNTAFGITMFALAFISGTNAHAQSNFKYSYIEAAYVLGEFKFTESSVIYNGYEVTGQFEVSPGFVVGVTYSSIDGDDVVTTAQGEQSLTVEGGGPDAYAFYHTPFGTQTDLILGATMEMSDFDAESESTSISQDEDTNLLFVGLRYQLTGLELHAQWFYNLDAQDDEDEWSYTLGLLSGGPAGLQLGFQFTPDNTGNRIGISVRQSY